MRISHLDLYCTRFLKNQHRYCILHLRVSTSYLRRNLNLIIESGVLWSLHPKCHHETCYAKFNLEIKYPLPSMWEVFHYKDANTEPIRQPINEFNWQKALPNTTSTSVNEKLDILNITILNNCNNSFHMK